MEHSDDDYVATFSEEEEEEDEEEEEYFAEYEQNDIEDEAGFLTGEAQREEQEVALEGEEGDEEEDEEEQADLFDDTFDPFAAMVAMEGRGAGPEDSNEPQPYEILAQRKRRARDRDAGEQSEEEGRDKRADAFGANVEDIAELTQRLGMAGRRRRKSKQKQRKKRPGARLRTLPAEVDQKLGEANLLYATSRYAEAVELLLEVIRLAPNLADTYHTLGMTYEAMGHTRKALDFFMIAAHLPPKDVALWRRLAVMSTEQGFLRQAIYCLNKVLASDRTDLDALWDKAVLLSEINMPKKAIEVFERIAVARPGDGEVPKMLARMYHRVQKLDEAVAVLERQVEAFPQEVDLTHINILAELYMERGAWGAAAALIHRSATLLCAAAGLPIDLQVKAGVCAAHEGDLLQAEAHFAALLHEDPATFADLYLQVGELLAAVGRHERAYEFYDRVRSCKVHSNPSLWARMADCQRALGSLDGCIALYKSVLAGLEEGEGSYVEAALALADLYCEAGRTDAAATLLAGIEDLSQEAEGAAGPASSMATLMRRANLLLQLGQEEGFLEVMLPVVAATVRRQQERAEQGRDLDPALQKALRRRSRLKATAKPSIESSAVFKGFTTRDRRKSHVRLMDEQAEAIASALSDADGQGLREGEAEEAAVFGDLARSDEQFRVLLRVLRALLHQRRPQEARHLAQACMDIYGRRWTDKSKRDTMRMVVAEADLDAGEHESAYKHIKAVCARWPHSLAAWNAFCRLGVAMGSIRHGSKFLTGLRGKHPTSPALMLLTSYTHALQGNHAEALGELFQAWRVQPQAPLVLLGLGVAYINQAMTKRVPDRHRCVLQGFAFLQEYAAARRCPQEAAYNLGRAAHQLGLLHLAVPYYEQALKEKPAPTGADGADGAFEMRREAAHNLAVIYKASGASDLARQVLREHFTV